MKPQCFKSVLNSVLHTPKDFSSLSKWKWPSFERDNHVGWRLGWEQGGNHLCGHRELEVVERDPVRLPSSGEVNFRLSV